MEAWEERLESVLRSWEGTPWMHGQCCRGRAVDCRYFIVGVLDELYGVTEPRPPRIAAGTATHNRPEAFAQLRAIMSRYPTRTITGEKPEPGDVLIIRPDGAHRDTLLHAMILGSGGRLWHAGGAGVAYTSLGGAAITHAFRTLERERWRSVARAIRI